MGQHPDTAASRTLRLFGVRMLVILDRTGRWGTNKGWWQWRIWRLQANRRALHCEVETRTRASRADTQRLFAAERAARVAGQEGHPHTAQLSGHLQHLLRARPRA
jgi:hypothetical protein